MLSSDVSKAGPHETEVPRKRSGAVIALVAMAAVLAALLSVSDRPAHRSPASSAEKHVHALPSVAPAANWHYSTNTVELTGEKQALACTHSPEGARLCFRETDGRLESFLAFPDGDKQFLCTRYHCTTQIKIDDHLSFALPGAIARTGTSVWFILVSRCNYSNRSGMPIAQNWVLLCMSRTALFCTLR